jgi:hypothetical protein
MSRKFLTNGIRRPKPSKTLQKVQQKEAEKVEMTPYRLRCEVELSAYRDLQTFNDCAKMGELAINSLISGARDAKTISTLGYLLAIQLQALRMMKLEQTPIEDLSHKLRQEGLSLNLTPEEAKTLVFATSNNVHIQILNKIVGESSSKDPILSIDSFNNTEIEIPRIITQAIQEAQKTIIPAEVIQDT